MASVPLILRVVHLGLSSCLKSCRVRLGAVRRDTAWMQSSSSPTPL